MRKQKIIQPLCWALSMLFVAACQPKVAGEAKKTSSDYQPSADQEDDDGDDGAYGDNDQSSQNLEVILISSEPETASAEETVAQEEKTTEEVAKHQVPPIDAIQSESTPEVPDDAMQGSIVEGSREADPRLEAVEAIRVISENSEILSTGE